MFASIGGGVTDVHLVTDRMTGRSRGFGFVTMASEQDATAAIEQMDGQVIEGRTIRVNEAQERPQRGGGGGGYHGGGDRRGGGGNRRGGGGGNRW
jgi:RNA recognition motif-containing protein